MRDDDTNELPARPCFECYPGAIWGCVEGTDDAEDCTHLNGGGTWESCSSGGEWCPHEWMEGVESGR